MNNDMGSLLKMKKYTNIGRELEEYQEKQRDYQNRFHNTSQLYKTLLAGERKPLADDDSKVLSNYRQMEKYYADREQQKIEEINKMPQEEKEFCRLILSNSVDEIVNLAENNQNSLASFYWATAKKDRDPEFAIGILKRVNKNAYYGEQCKNLLEIVQGIEIAQSCKAQDRDAKGKINGFNRKINGSIEKLNKLDCSSELNDEKKRVIEQLEIALHSNNRIIQKIEKGTADIFWRVIAFFVTIACFIVFEIGANLVYAKVDPIRRVGERVGTPLFQIYGKKYNYDINLMLEEIMKKTQDEE